MGPDVPHTPTVHGADDEVGIREIPEIAYLQQELGAWLQYFFERNGIALDQFQNRAIAILSDKFSDECYLLLEKHLFPNAINRYTQEDLEQFYIPAIMKKLTEDPTAFCVVLDQAIYYMVREKVPEEYRGRMAELSMTRPHGNLYTDAAGGKVARISYPSLDDQVREIKEAVGDGKVFLVDDTTVEGGTMRTAQELLEQGGVEVMSPENHMVYFITRREESGMHRPPPPYKHQVTMQHSRGSVEMREFTVFGGAQASEFDRGNRAFVIPAFPPFSNGTALRMAKNDIEILNLTDAAREILRLNQELVVNLAGVLEMEPGEFTLGKFNVLPTEAPVRSGRKTDYGFLTSALNNSLGRSERHSVTQAEIVKFANQTPIVDYLQKAVESVDKREKPETRVVCTDIDGTMAHMKPISPAFEGIPGPRLFTESMLGHHVLMNGRLALRQLLRGDQLATVSKLGGQNVEQIMQIFYDWGLAGVAEEKFGEPAKARIHEIFRDAYGEGRGIVEAERFIASMPLHYHALRHLTWDLDIPAIYEHNTESVEFAQNILRRGGELAFITAAPRIHAVKMLKFLGLMDDPGPRHFKLYTVEQLYAPESIPRNGHFAKTGMFVEREKNVVLDDLVKRFGVPKKQVVMAGDVFRTEVQPALFNGYPARVVRNPSELASYALNVRLPNDANALCEECKILFDSKKSEDTQDDRQFKASI